MPEAPIGAVALHPEGVNAALRVDLGGGPEWRYVFIPHSDCEADSWSIVYGLTLPSLDCQQARNGTVWRDSSLASPWLYRYVDGQWWWKPTYGRNWHPFRHSGERLRLILTRCGPYTAVAQSADESP